MQKINIAGKIEQQVSLSKYTTLRVGGPAAYYAEPVSTLDLVTLVNSLVRNECPYYPLGSGSNLLVSDSGYEGCIISLRRMNRVAVRGLFLTAGAGALMDKLITVTAEKRISGLESFTGIPGTLGGCIATNAGAYGKDVGSLVEWVDFLSVSGEMHRLFRDDKGFNYRISPFMGSGAVITEAALRLSSGNSAGIQRSLSKFQNDRKGKGYYEYPTAGSIFKNPAGIEITAGELIDTLGLKGYAVGDAQISSVHGNIIVNKGKASAQDIARLIDHVKAVVFREIGISLEEEIVRLGSF